MGSASSYDLTSQALHVLLVELVGMSASELESFIAVRRDDLLRAAILLHDWNCRRVRTSFGFRVGWDLLINGDLGRVLNMRHLDNENRRYEQCSGLCERPANL